MIKVSEISETFMKWEHMDSNQGPSACKADALNQLSYAPKVLKNKRVSLNGPSRCNRDALNLPIIIGMSYAPVLRLQK